MQKNSNPGILAAAVVTALIVSAGAYMYLSGKMDFKPKTAAAQEATYTMLTGSESKLKIKIYYGDAEAVGFRGVEAEIAETAENVNKVKQALEALFKNPLPQGCMNALPQGLELREAYLDNYGILYIDLPESITADFSGGSTSEYTAVYSVIHTVFQNFNFVKGIRFLINGKEAETLAGHIDISGIIRP